VSDCYETDKLAADARNVLVCMDIFWAISAKNADAAIYLAKITKELSDKAKNLSHCADSCYYKQASKARPG
jgi:hypothetical protein